MFNIGHKHSSGDGKRKIFTPDEIMTFPLNKELIIFRGKHVMEAFKYDFSLHPEAERFKTISIKDRPNINDMAGRAAYKAKADAYMKAYLDRILGKEAEDKKTSECVDISDGIELQDADCSEYEDEGVSIVDDIVVQDMSLTDVNEEHKEITSNMSSRIVNTPDEETIRKNAVTPPENNRVFRYRAN